MTGASLEDSCPFCAGNENTISSSHGEAYSGVPVPAYPPFCSDPSPNDLQVFHSQTPESGQLPVRTTSREQALGPACVLIPEPCFKFRSGFRSCNNNKGEEEEEKEREKAS